ncbi:HIT domain-containing protein [Candidatus Woesearchaeota archaeon]|nr:HIT domain-containing protein [Candidatus Woesearchaeota archaeon]
MSDGHDHGHEEHSHDDSHGHDSHSEGGGHGGQASQLTAEQLKNMSPEEIRALQKQNCIFCHIISGRVASKKVYEDETVIAILDINPLNPGHVLLMPREHYQIMPQIPDETIERVFAIAKNLSHAVLRALQVKGTNIFVANGAAAGQRAPHFMVHIIPRKEGDNVKIFSLPKQSINPADEKLIYNRLKERINKAFGITEKQDTKSHSPEAEEYHHPEESHNPPENEESHTSSNHEEPTHDLNKITSRFTPQKKDKDDDIDLDKIAEMLG